MEYYINNIFHTHTNDQLTHVRILRTLRVSKQYIIYIIYVNHFILDFKCISEHLTSELK